MKIISQEWVLLQLLTITGTCQNSTNQLNRVFNVLSGASSIPAADALVLVLCTVKIIHATRKTALDTCTKPLKKVAETCWPQSSKVYLYNTLGFVMQYFCGDDNDGAKAWRFVAKNGIKCYKDQASSLRECLAGTSGLIALNLGVRTESDICGDMKKEHDCFRIHMNKWDSDEPGNIMTGMIREVSARKGCPKISAASGKLSVMLNWLIVSIILAV